VKAIATSRHAATAALHRYESRAMLVIPAGPAVPRLYATYDDGDWVGLLLEDIEGRHPVPWTLSDVHRVTTVIDQRVRAFTPSPWPEVERLEDASPGMFRPAAAGRTGWPGQPGRPGALS
jgi:hypothetical protein